MPETEPKKKSGSCLFNALKIVLVLVVVAVAAFLSVGWFGLSGKYAVSREILINAPPHAVYAQVGDLREWPNWLPFTKHEPTIKTEIEKPTGVGAHQHWSGKGGTGELTFTSSDEDEGVKFDMLFDGRWASVGAITYGQVGKETRVTWHMSGQNKDFVGKWMALIMPSMVGPMFEEGLTDLKNKVEGQ